jgi:hypothetical protein
MPPPKGIHVKLPGLRRANRSEFVRVGVDVLAVVQRDDTDCHRGLGRHHVLTQLPRPLDKPHDDRDDRADSHSLVDRRLGVRVGRRAVIAHRIAQSGIRRRRAHQPLERPCQGVGGRFVPGEYE